MNTAYNVLSGKKWAVCGDSFTNGLAQNAPIPAGPYQGQRSVYPYLIANRNGMELAPFFEGGRTLAYPPEPGEFRNSLTAPDMPWNYQNIHKDHIHSHLIYIYQYRKNLYIYYQGLISKSIQQN